MRSQAGLSRGAELTWRGIVLGAAITLVFTAANVYLGLKVGLTFASSIPAAVISMAVLRAFRNTTIYENNIVQTLASAAGTLSSIIFVLPGLIMVGWWTGFPFWQSFGVCAIGGVLGVMYSVPLRRALVVQTDLPYPEGVAAAEVLRVGSAASAGAENNAGLLAIAWGAIVSAGYAALAATQTVASEIDVFFRSGAIATGNGIQYSFALLGVGHLVGISVGLAMLVGVAIAWVGAVPILTALHPTAGAAADVATSVWRHQVRFIGAGEIGIAAIWALGKLAAPVARGVASALATARRIAAGEGDALPLTERDIPIKTVALISLAMLVPLAVLLVTFLAGGALGGLIVPLVIGAVIYVVLAGFLVAAACGYMAGLIGSSNSPVSGLAILTVVGASLLLLAVAKTNDPHGAAALVAFALFVTAIVLCVATIANDNLQDLKTGQLVDATPWRQQVALVIGVIVGAAVIPPILNLMQAAYGFTGPHALPAPQATLISALAKGVIEGQIDWTMIGIGALVGVAMIALDEVLGRLRLLRLPPLATGLGIYLPAATITPIVLGALVGRTYEAWVARGPHAESARQLGVLLASGLIVGESLFGVLLAGLIVATHREAPLALVGDAFQGTANIVGTILFFVLVVVLYRWIGRLARR